MALGDTFNNNEKKNYSPSVSSGYRFSNPESNIDKTALTFTYWNKLLKISIAPKKQVEGDTIAFDYDNAGSVYLSHTKALVFYKEIMTFIEEWNNGNPTTNRGVSSGRDGLVYICNGKEFNASVPCLVIRKVDEHGKCISTYVYEFRTKMHTSVINFTERTSDFETGYYELLEVEQLANLLKSYYESMTLAVAYSIQEVEKYDQSRLNTKLKVIGDKLGVEFKSNTSNNSGRTVNNSYFSSAKQSSTGSHDYNGPSTSYESGSLDDLD